MNKELIKYIRHFDNHYDTEILNECHVKLNLYLKTLDEKILNDKELYYGLVVISRRWITKDKGKIPEDVLETISCDCSSEIIGKVTKSKKRVIENLMAYYRRLTMNILRNYFATLYNHKYDKIKGAGARIFSVEEFIDENLNNELDLTYYDDNVDINITGAFSHYERQLHLKVSLGKFIEYTEFLLKNNDIINKDYWKYSHLLLTSVVANNFTRIDLIKNNRIKIILKLLFDKIRKVYNY